MGTAPPVLENNLMRPTPKTKVMTEAIDVALLAAAVLAFHGQALRCWKGPCACRSHRNNS